MTAGADRRQAGQGATRPEAGERLHALLEAPSGTRAALVCPDDGRVQSFEELGAAVERLAGTLAALGVRRGDRVALVLPNGPEIVQLLLALNALGAAAAPLNPAYTEPECAFYLCDLTPRLLIVPEGGGSAARRAAGDLPVVELRGGDAAPWLLAGGAPVERTAAFEAGDADDVALLLHTSGTTSRPKQVPLLQRNLTASAHAIADHYALRADDVSYCAMPLFHVHGLVGSTLSQLSAGGAVVTPRRFAPRRFAAQCREHGVTWFSAGPTFHQSILEHAPERFEGLRFVRSCSSALSPALMERAEGAYGAPMLEAYGMTEASHQMTSNPLPPARRAPGSVGVPAGAAVRVVDESWRELPEGTEGEVTVTGPGLTPGYLGNPQANEESFREGWFRTGDQGVVRDGYLYLQGRLKEMINRGGEKISPAEVEEVLLAHSAVAEAVCFAVPDEKYGQDVGAAVVLAGSVDERDLRAHCRRSLAPFKVPGTIRLVDAIPRTPTGKVQRRLVAAALEDSAQ